MNQSDSTTQETDAHLRLKAAVKKANDDAAIHALHALKRTYQLCLQHSITGTAIPVDQVLQAIGMNLDGNITQPLPPKDTHA